MNRVQLIAYQSGIETFSHLMIIECITHKYMVCDNCLIYVIVFCNIWSSNLEDAKENVDIDTEHLYIVC